MKLLIKIAVGILILSALAYPARRMRSDSRDINVSGMAKVWLSDGRIIYGAAQVAMLLTQSNSPEMVKILVVAEPGMIDFQRETAFNFKSSSEVEIGISGSEQSLTDRSILNIIIPGWGSLAFLTPENLRATPWSITDRTVQVEGTETGFVMKLSP
ncbi:MAG: hypothetical protein JXA73_08855 [Acidobacteria bacterium]|nr:hypothetical protein [Acidobacteriota bacterium]